MTTRPAIVPHGFNEEEKVIYQTRIAILCEEGPITVEAEMIATDEVMEFRRRREDETK